MGNARSLRFTSADPAKRAINALFFACYLYAFNFAFFFTTMYSLKSWVPEHLEDLRWYLILGYGITLSLCVIKLFSEYEGIRDRILPLFIIFAALGLSVENNITNREIALFLLLVVASKGQSLKKILTVGVINGALWLIICFLGTRAGIIDDLVYEGHKHSFGIGYNTDLMSHILFLVISYCIIRGLKMNIFDLFVIALLDVINMFFIRGKVAFVCMILILLSTIWFRYVLPRMDKISSAKMYKKTGEVIGIIMIGMPVILAVMSFIFTLMYKDTTTPAIDTVFKHFHTLRARYILGGRAFNDYKVTCWGQWVYELGNGGSTTPVTSDKYFALDISYIKIFFSFGVIPLLAYLTLMVTAAIRCFRNKRFDLLCLTAIIALDCAVEHHLYCVAYNIPLFMAMADWDLGDGFEWRSLRLNK